LVVTEGAASHRSPRTGVFDVLSADPRYHLLGQLLGLPEVLSKGRFVPLREVPKRSFLPTTRLRLEQGDGHAMLGYLKRDIFSVELRA
jgi:hypothetical protein